MMDSACAGDSYVYCLVSAFSFASRPSRPSESYLCLSHNLLARLASLLQQPTPTVWFRHLQTLLDILIPAESSMLGDDDDVFDSVTWESSAAQPYDVGGPSGLSGPGFIQSTAEVEPGQGPNDPKWEGYLITTVKDPMKELAETKDAYVSYLVTAKVSVSAC